MGIQHLHLSEYILNEELGANQTRFWTEEATDCLKEAVGLDVLAAIYEGAAELPTEQGHRRVRNHIRYQRLSPPNTRPCHSNGLPDGPWSVLHADGLS